MKNIYGNDIGRQTEYLNNILSETQMMKDGSLPLLKRRPWGNIATGEAVGPRRLMQWSFLDSKQMARRVLLLL